MDDDDDLDLEALVGDYGVEMDEEEAQDAVKGKKKKGGEKSVSSSTRKTRVETSPARQRDFEKVGIVVGAGLRPFRK